MIPCESPLEIHKCHCREEAGISNLLFFQLSALIVGLGKFVKSD